MQNVNVQSLKNTVAVLLFAVALIAVTALNSQRVSAQGDVCYGPYGEVIDCPVVNKSFNVQKAVLLDGNLFEEVRGVKAGNEVTFNLAVKNTGELNNTTVTVVENLPSNLEFVSLSYNGDAVQVNVEQNSVSWTIKNFDAGAKRVYLLTAKANRDGIADNTEKCVTNIVNLMYKGTKESSNTASVCISTKTGEVLGDKDKPTVLPDTDISNVTMVGVAVIAMILGGLFFMVSQIAEEKVQK